MQTKKRSLVRLTESAIMIAFATVLSEIKMFEMPMGGNITAFSMLPVIIIAYRYGFKWGLLTGFTSGLFQMLLGMNNLRYGVNFLAVVCIILFDYLVAFGVQGLGGLFRSKWKSQALGLSAGVILVCFLRFLCHFITGITVWSAFAPAGTPVWLYSLGYNASYMVPETILTVVGALLISLVLDFTSPDITRRRAKSDVTPRNGTATITKLTGILVIIGGILYAVATVTHAFVASFSDESVVMPEAAALLGIVAVTLVLGVFLFAIGEIVQFLCDLRGAKE